MKNTLIACIVVLLVSSGAAAHEPDCKALDKAIVELQILTADVTSQAWLFVLFESGFEVKRIKHLRDLSVPTIKKALLRRIMEFKEPYDAINREAGCGGNAIPKK